MEDKKIKQREKIFFDYAKEIEWLKYLETDETSRLVWDKEIKFVKRKFCKNKKVLDIGCGDLRYTSLWKKFGAKVCIGYDISSKFMRFGLSKKVKYAYKYKITEKPDSCVQGDCETLPFKSNSFDTVFIFHLLHHLEEQDETIKEVFRVLKNGGHVIISEVNSKHPMRKIVSFLGKKVKLLTKDENPIPPSKVIEILSDGFKIKKIYYTSPSSVIIFNLSNALLVKKFYLFSKILRLLLPFSIFIDDILEKTIIIPSLFWRYTIIAQKLGK